MTDAQKEWQRCKHWIEAALVYARGTHLIEDVEAGIANGTYQFWPGERSAIVSEIIVYPRLKALNFWLIGGDLSELKEMEPIVVAWAKTQGCTRFMGVGRWGMQRAFRSQGYEPWWFAIAKDI